MLVTNRNMATSSRQRLMNCFRSVPQPTLPSCHTFSRRCRVFDAGKTEYRRASGWWQMWIESARRSQPRRWTTQVRLPPERFFEKLSRKSANQQRIWDNCDLFIAIWGQRFIDNLSNYSLIFDVYAGVICWRVWIGKLDTVFDNYYASIGPNNWLFIWENRWPHPHAVLQTTCVSYWSLKGRTILRVQLVVPA